MTPNDFQILKKLENNPDFPHFVQICTEALVSSAEPNFQRLNLSYPKEDYRLLHKAVNNIYKNAAVHGQITFPEGFPEFLRNHLQRCFIIYQHQIENLLARDKILQRDVNLVESFDWKLKWIIGASKLASIREPILQIDLRCASGPDQSTETINFEANLGKIDELISSLSSVEKELTELKTLNK